MLGRALLIAGLTAMAAPVAAQVLEPVVDLCSDPLTNGPEKLARLPALGWAEAAPEAERLHDLALVHILGLTSGIPDLEERFAQTDVLAQNFANMIGAGQITLWQNGEALLAFSVAATPQGTEQVSCYYAGPPSDETFQIASRYGEPEELPELELRALRFDETAMTFDPDRTYLMYSTWTRLMSDPPRGPLTDGYRLERVEQPPQN
ncbi:hypothetical protein ACXN5S_17100 [Pseudoroseicyclus sp. H15]